MEFGLTREQEQFVREVDSFCEAECRNIDIGYLEEKGTDPEELEAKLVSKGWYGLPFPKEYGGAGKGYFDVGLLIERLARGGYPYPGRLQITTLNGLSVLENGTRKQKLDILPKIAKGEQTMSISVTEPNAGSDVASLSTMAEQKNGGYVINGQKVYSSGARGDKNIIMVAARTDPSQKGRKGLTLFLVPANTPGLKFVRMKSMGRNIGGLYEVFFDDVWVTEEHVLGEVNKGWVALTRGFNVERAIVSAGYLGFAERIFIDALSIAKQRYGQEDAEESRGAVMTRIAEFESQIQAGKLLTYKTLHLADQDKPSIETVCHCKIYTSELARRLGDFCAEIAGGQGYMSSSMVQWYFRESRILTVGGGSSQIMRNVAGAQLGLK